MNKIKIIIADDEPLVRERIAHLLDDYKDIVICDQCSDGDATILSLKKYRPDVLFLDIMMPKYSGFDVLDNVNIDEVLVVFVTAFDEYALRAFEYAAFDYLVKPITLVRFRKTLRRIIQRLNESDSKNNATINIKDDNRILKIKIGDITHLKSSDNHVLIYTGNMYFKKRITMTTLLIRLQNHGIVRVHRSYAIQPAHIESMVRVYKGDYLIKMKGGKVVPTSNRYRHLVSELTIS